MNRFERFGGIRERKSNDKNLSKNDSTKISIDLPLVEQPLQDVHWAGADQHTGLVGLR